MVAGHFAERHFAERHFAERHFAEGTFCRRTLCRTNISSNGQFDKRTFRRKDILPKRKLAENREILGDVTRTAYDWLLNRTSQSYNQLDDRNFDSKVSFVLYSFTFLTNRSEICLHRFRYICLFVYDATSRHVPKKWFIHCTNNLTIVNMVMNC